MGFTLFSKQTANVSLNGWPFLMVTQRSLWSTNWIYKLPFLQHGTLRITRFFGLSPSTSILKSTEKRFENWICFLSSGEGGDTYSLFNHWKNPCQYNYSYVEGHNRKICNKNRDKNMHRLESRIFAFLSILVSGLCMLYHNFYCIFFCYLPST
jgi:hypothetical protein